jgi:hypothetical protein
VAPFKTTTDTKMSVFHSQVQIEAISVAARFQIQALRKPTGMVFYHWKKPLKQAAKQPLQLTTLKK